MTREQKIWRLNKHCSRHKCNQEECRIYQECSDSAGELLETLDDTEIDKLYNKDERFEDYIILYNELLQH